MTYKVEVYFDDRGWEVQKVFDSRELADDYCNYLSEEEFFDSEDILVSEVDEDFLAWTVDELRRLEG